MFKFAFLNFFLIICLFSSVGRCDDDATPDDAGEEGATPAAGKPGAGPAAGIDPNQCIANVTKRFKKCVDIPTRTYAANMKSVSDTEHEKRAKEECRLKKSKARCEKTMGTGTMTCMGMPKLDESLRLTVNEYFCDNDAANLTDILKESAKCFESADKCLSVDPSAVAEERNLMLEQACEKMGKMLKCYSSKNEKCENAEAQILIEEGRIKAVADIKPCHGLFKSKFPSLLEENPYSGGRINSVTCLNVLFLNVIAISFFM